MLQFSLYLLAAAVAFFIVAVGAAFWIARQRRIIQEYEAESREAAQEDHVAGPAETTGTRSRKVPFLSLVTRKPLLTDNEREFFPQLLQALPQYHVFTQVAFSALIQPVKTLPPDESLRVFRKFSQKRADFVVCTRDTLQVVAVIELDDSTHNEERDRWRDGLLRAGGYDVYRFQSTAKPSLEQMAALFKKKGLAA